jgi:hypothetical protein
MAGYGVFNGKDIDNRWWSFAQQNRDNSCVPTCAKIAKELYHNRPISEEAIRGQIGLQYSGRLNTGITLSQAARASDGRWRLVGSNPDQILIPALKSQPAPILSAMWSTRYQDVLRASRNHPALLTFLWDGGGGHEVVCVGPTKTDPSLLVILDPDGGIQYLSVDDRVGNSFVYHPSYGGTGRTLDYGYAIT